ncbi:MAG: hypothetical protein ACREMF_08545, partial [Gemmatimonadales bacterium]
MSGLSTWWWRHLAPVAVAALAGCGHESPLVVEDYAPNEPSDTGPLVRLTYNPGVDLGPSWLPDGSGFLYTAQRIDRADVDRCFALLPAAGGTIQREICNRAPAADDSLNVYTAPASASDGRLAYVRATSSLAVGPPLFPHYHELVLATLAGPDQAAVLERLPVTGPSGAVYGEVTHLHWLGEGALVFVAQHVEYVSLCRGCPPDTLSSGVEIARIELGGPTPTLSVLPRTDQASSLDVAGSDTIYFTVNADPRVFRLILSIDLLEVVRDFGAGVVARDVQVVGQRLVAVVGGNVATISQPGVGTFQVDSGGTLVLVDLAGGLETPLTPPGLLFRRPALSPDGRRVVAEQV